MITRLRPAWPPEKLEEFYTNPYKSSEWPEHVARVNWTIERLKLFLEAHPEIGTIADLSCGDGVILDDVRATNKIYGDISQGADTRVRGPIEETILQVQGDLLICSETLEHLDDPGTVLGHAATRFDWICITTPLGETDPEKNYEHYWGWDLWGMSSLLSENGWLPRWVDTLNQPYYTYQLWIARTAWD